MEIKSWDGQFLGEEVAIDTETTIAPFTSRDHRLITFQAYAGKGVCFFVEKKDIRSFLNKHIGSRLIFHNAPFDVGVLEHEVPKALLHRFYDNNQIFDTLVMFKLLHLAVVGYVPPRNLCTLKALSGKVLNRHMAKDMEVRGTFEQFEHTPTMQIPKEWLRYAAQDAANTYDIYCTLLAEITKIDNKGTLLSHHIQVKGHYATDNMIKNGMGVDLDRVKELTESIKKDIKGYEDRLAVWGWVRGRPNIRLVEAQIFERIGIKDKMPKTDTGLMSKSYDHLTPYKDMPFVSDYMGFIKLEKLLVFLKPLTEKVLHPQYEFLINTGRMSCSKPNFQNLPRAGDVRSCFVPQSKGNTFAIIDYTGVELCTLAQIQYDKFGTSTMGDLLNDGVDLHTFFARKAFDKKDITKEERQLGKIFNFGNGANMKPETFVDYARGAGITVPLKKAYDMKSVWIETFPEVKNFFNDASRAMVKHNRAPMSETLTGRQRADCTYPSYLNTQFQGLASDGIKLAMYELVKQGYSLVGVVHDEIIVEVPKGFNVKPIEDIMVAGMRKVVPDVRIAVDTTMSDRYCK